MPTEYIWIIIMSILFVLFIIAVIHHQRKK